MNSYSELTFGPHINSCSYHILASIAWMYSTLCFCSSTETSSMFPSLSFFFFFSCIFCAALFYVEGLFEAKRLTYYLSSSRFLFFFFFFVLKVLNHSGRLSPCSRPMFVLVSLFCVLGNVNACRPNVKLIWTCVKNQNERRCWCHVDGDVPPPSIKTQ